jgi:hypothetical protein
MMFINGVWGWVEAADIRIFGYCGTFQVYILRIILARWRENGFRVNRWFHLRKKQMLAEDLRSEKLSRNALKVSSADIAKPLL